MSLLLTRLVEQVRLNSFENQGSLQGVNSRTVSFLSFSSCSFKRNNVTFIDCLNQISPSKTNTCFKDLGNNKQRESVLKAQRIGNTPTSGESHQEVPFQSFLHDAGPVDGILHNRTKVSVGMEKEMATHSSTLAWKIPWTEEPGRL